MYIIKELSNGIRVFGEKIEYVQSVSLGVWINNGSRHERREENGMSHFIEHMLFKGTNSRSAEDIALEMDSIGGQLNAFTTRENTCFYAKTLNEYVEKAADILSDMVFEPSLCEEDMNMERRVIFEEIAMYEDSPEDVAYDLFADIVWGDTAMGRPILGTEQSLNNITPDTMREYMKNHYTSKSIVIAVTGNFDDSLFDLLEKYFGQRKLNDNDAIFEDAHYNSGRGCLCRDFEQVQLIAGFNGIDIYDESVYELLVFNNVFGCGMSSRLFQNIREKYGLVYSVGAGHSAYVNTGTFDILAATMPENVERVSELICEEIKKIKETKLTADEIERSKIQLKGNYILSSEGVGSRMQAMGRAALLNRPLRTPEETIGKIMAVTEKDVSDIIDRVLDVSTLSVAVVGPIQSDKGLFLL